ncbi:MAG: acetyl-CoA carboxylase biotin carboxylase subunit [Planctomycetota bacterium]
MSDGKGLEQLKCVLIANRGEIAIRIIRACHRLGIPTAIVHSTVDRDSRALRLADRAVCIGEPEAKASYLNIDRILEACRETGSNAVHPGYGFLAENSEFARRVREAGLFFIGPQAEAIDAMGDKINSRRMMIEAGVPVVPGIESDEFTPKELKAAAKKIGYPVMLKATAGGGGKGIRIVQKESELWDAYERSVSESEKAFGNGMVYIEKAIEGPHHIEFQIFGDAHGNYLHLHERECSVQRRHQKVVEEAPSPFMTPKLHAAMASAAVQAAAAIGYQNAGTVEFLVDRDRNFYFLEMNTRLQVEHPVTEMILGVDLVEEQLRVAVGMPLSFQQKDLVPRGHAVEVRICAEDPDNNYLPAIGCVKALTLPSGPGVRVDSALFPGMEVSLYYDSMLAKLIVWGADRAAAIAGLRQALAEFKIAGLKTNIPFLGSILRDEAFRRGEYDTSFLTHFEPAGMRPEVLEAALAAAVLYRHTRQSAARAALKGTKGGGLDPWKAAARGAGVNRR